MATGELSEIDRPIRDEYITLLEDIAIFEGVAPDIIRELLKAKRYEEKPMLARGIPISIKLSVDKKFPINLDSKKAGRVFELVGQSDRNKTTSLIYMATLFGIDWDETRPFLDNDGRVFNTATNIVRSNLSAGQNAQLQIVSKSYELSINVADGRAIISLLDENRRFVPEYDNLLIPLTSSEDWQHYCTVMKPICDVQFVGKSRDFIGQVSSEEIKDLSQFCETVSDRAGRVRSYIQSLPQAYGRTAEEWKAEITQASTRLAELKIEIEVSSRQIEILNTLIGNMQTLISVYRELQDYQNSEVQEVIRLLNTEEVAKDKEKTRIELESSIRELGRELDREQQQFSLQEPRFNKVKNSLEELRGKISSELKNLSTLNSLCSQILREITNKDYSPMFDFCNYALVNNETIRLLDTILEASKVFSKALVIPLASIKDPGIKLVDFEKDLLSAKVRATDIQKLNPELTNAYQALQEAHLSSALELRRLASDVSTIQNLILNKKRLLDGRRDELLSTDNDIKSLLGAESFQSLTLRISQLRQSLSLKQKELLEQVERLCHEIGYNDPWQLNLTTLQSAIVQSQAKLQEYKDSKASKEDVEAKLKTRLYQLQRDAARSTGGKTPVHALSRLQDVLRSLVNYLEEYRRRREGAPLYDPQELEQLTKTFNEHFEKVRKTIDRVIVQRCPVMYKNRETGPERLTVQDYDFLRGKPSILELLDGEWSGGGGDSAMTVLGLASRSSGSHIGTILLVDEFNDAETFKIVVRDDLTKLKQLALAIFVKQDPAVKEVSFEEMK